MTLNGMHTKSYPNGGVYEGEFLRGKMHGTGVYTCPNGDRSACAACAWHAPRAPVRVRANGCE